MPEIKSINDIPICDATARTKIEDIESNYATKLDLESRAHKNHAHDQYLTEHQSLANYATKEFVNDAIEKISIPPEIDTTLFATKLDLKNYYTKSEIDDKKYLTSVPDNYVTEAKLTNKGFATKTYVDNAIANIQSPEGSIDLSQYALKTDIPSLENYYDITTIDSIVSEFVKTDDYNGYQDVLTDIMNSFDDRISQLENKIKTLEGDDGNDSQ